MKQQTIIFVIIAIVIVAIGVVFLSGYQLPTYQTPTTTTIPPEEQPTPPPETPEQPAPTTKIIDVEIKNFAFSPTTIIIKVGDSIRWTNRDNVGHTATADDSSFDTELLGTGQSKIITFDKTGTYDYHCTPHPWMKAKIIVE